MKLTSLLFESIPLPPRNRKLWFANLFKKLRAIAGRVDQMYKERSFHFTDEDVAYWMDQVLRGSTNYELDRSDLEYEIKQFAEAHTKLISHIEDLWDSLIKYDDKFSRYDRAKYLGYMLDYIRRARIDYNDRPKFPQLKKAGSYAQAVDEFIKESGDYYEENLDWFPEFLVEISKRVNDWWILLDEAEVKIGRLQSMFSVYREEDLKPKTENVEQLYHTTVNATTLAQTGFSNDFYNKPKEEGLGGSRSTHSGKGAVSFTADLYVAKEIMRTLKEAIWIAQGKLSFFDIERMAGEEGILDEVMKQFVDSQGDVNDKSKETYDRRIRRAKDYSWDKEDPKAQVKRRFDRNNPTNVMLLYRWFLAYSKRYDPLFFGDMAQLMTFLKTKKEEDVGILVCSIDMTNEEITYLQAMEEWRVPVDSILSIDKVLK